jgi:hypothetical protein
LATAYSKTIKENFGTLSSPGWEEAFIGGLTGFLGSPSFQRKEVKGDDGKVLRDPKTNKPIKKTRLTMAGGIWDARREVNEAYEENQQLVDDINERL